ncbi:hypothetical protein Tco_0974685 [Tanacetum coccineum]|uniref:Uncharacterized protein n=1 Tax=Tanacetum coccineum TaxID=301880 RepID=A0ABQ5ECB5_9ASTR
MDWRSLITKLRYKAESSDWSNVLTYFCREAADEDINIATKLNRLREEMLIICEKRRNLMDELRSIRGIVVVQKAAEFVADTVRKDNLQVAQLREVESQMEFRALEKELHVGCAHELAGVADSTDIKDQLLVLFRREANEESQKMHDYRRLSDELRENVRMRYAYIEEFQRLQMYDSSDEVIESIEILKNLKKCLSDETLVIPLDEIQTNDKLHFIEEPVEIIDHEIKRLKQSHTLDFENTLEIHGEVMNLLGNVKIKSKRDVNIFSPALNHRRILHHELQDEALLTGKLSSSSISVNTISDKAISDEIICSCWLGVRLSEEVAFITFAPIDNSGVSSSLRRVLYRFWQVHFFPFIPINLLSFPTSGARIVSTEFINADDNEIRDAENESRIKTLETDHANKGLAKVGAVAYRLELSTQLCRVHSIFLVSDLKKCLSDETLVIPLDEIQTNDKLHFIEEPVEIIDHEVKRLKQSHTLDCENTLEIHGEVMNLLGNVKIKSERDVHIFSPALNHHRILHRELRDEALLTGKVCHTS